MSDQPPEDTPRWVKTMTNVPLFVGMAANEWAKLEHAMVPLVQLLLNTSQENTKIILFSGGFLRLLFYAFLPGFLFLEAGDFNVKGNGYSFRFRKKRINTVEQPGWKNDQFSIARLNPQCAGEQSFPRVPDHIDTAARVVELEVSANG